MAYNVVIAGAGPVGLFLACELSLAGVRVVVLEKSDSAASELKNGWLGGRGLNLPSTEAFYRRGMLAELKASAFGWMDTSDRPGMRMMEKDGASAAAASAPRFAGHFAGMMLDANKVNFAHHEWVLPGPGNGGGMVSLGAIESLLTEQAQKLGVEIRMGHEVTGLSTTDSGVNVETAGGDFEAKWLVGCDGGRSAVRKLAGFTFEGTEPELTGYTAMVEIEDLDGLAPGFNLTPRGLYTHGPAPGRVGVVDFDGGAFDRTSEITLENLQTMLRHVSGTNVTLKSVELASSYTDRARQATTYRNGRVFLAGDAAHVHSPFGGQGLNTGLGDAMNLGWKLAAAVHGWAPEDLLDTYTTERHPIGEWVLNWTRAQVSIIRPDPHARAMAAIVRDLIATADGTNYFVEKISGISMRYELGGEHALIGRSAPDFAFDDGKRLGEWLQDGRGVLVNFSDNDLSGLCNGRENRLRYLHAHASDEKGLTAVVVRPDGFVGWATDARPEVAAVAPAVERWFGAASV
jgi:2-polyprenyl-6-methoxyphenol hydroxylase-like FAD-dependent oxidoreductase